MLSLLIVIGCLVSFGERGVSEETDNRETEGHIVYGTFADPGEYPYVVQFITFRDPNGELGFCGGTILSKWWIVTAAHCVHKDPIYVIVGKYNRSTISPYEVMHNITFGVVHKLYNTNGRLNYDIALLKMEKRIEFNDYVQKANFPTSDLDYSGHTGTIIGWGFITTYGPSSDVLRETQVVIESREQCQRTRAEHKIKGEEPFPYEVCAEGDDYQGSCYGDSGGPLIIREANKDIVIGLTSKGRRPCGSQPVLYVLIYKFQNWINGIVRNYTSTRSIQGGFVRQIRA